MFFNAPLVVAPDLRHSQNEPRAHALGKTNEGRSLHITFTLRLEGEKCDRSRQAICIGKKDKSMKKSLEPMPEFKTEAEERKFWETHDSTDYVDWSGAQG
jgi:hypothetical protein